MNQTPAEFVSASVNVRIGNLMVCAHVNPIYDLAPPAPMPFYPADAQNDAMFAGAPPSVATGNDSGGAFPADPQQPQVSGKLGDGKLLEAGLRIFKLLRELGVLKA